MSLALLACRTTRVFGHLPQIRAIFLVCGSWLTFLVVETRPLPTGGSAAGLEALSSCPSIPHRYDRLARPIIVSVSDVARRVIRFLTDNHAAFGVFIQHRCRTTKRTGQQFSSRRFGFRLDNDGANQLRVARRVRVSTTLR